MTEMEERPTRGRDGWMAGWAGSPVRSIALGVALSLALVLLSGLALWGVYRAEGAEEEAFALQRLVHRVTVIDEAMTRAARMAAVTGHPEWERHYRELEPELELTIQRTVEGSGRIQQRAAAERLREAELRMAGMERGAFALVRQGELPAALQRISTPEYEEQKRALAGAVREIGEAAADLRQSAGASVRRRVLLAGALAAIVLLGLAAVWTAVIRMVQGHIREQRRAAEALSASQAELRALMKGMRDVILVLDAHGRYVSIPPGVPLLYRPPAELIGRTMHEVFPAEVAGPFLDTVRRALATGETEHLEYSLPVGDRTVWFSAAVSPMSEDRVIWVARDITRLKQAEGEIEKQRASLRAVIDTSPNLIFAKDRNGRFTLANRAVAQVYGTTPEGLVGKTDADFSVSAAEVERFLADDREVIETGRAKVIPEEPVSNPETGETRWFQTRKVRLLPPDGGPPQVLGIATDVTERKEAEEREQQLFRMEAARVEAEAARARIAGILESITDAFLAVDAECRFTYLNRRAEAIFGRSREELLGRSLWEEFPALVDSPFAPPIRRALAEREPLRFEGSYAPTGAWYEVHLYPSPEGVSVYFRDITERKRAEGALRESEERFRELAENIREVFWMFTPDFSRVLYVNPAYERVFGRSVESLHREATSFLDAIHPEDRSAVRGAMGRVGHEEVSVEFRVVRPDGEVRWLRAHGNPVRDAGGEVRRVAGISEDVTEYHEALAALRGSEQRFRLMVESVRDYAIILLDPEGRVVHWNPGAGRVKGYREEEILGRHMSTFYRAEDVAAGRPQRILEVATREGHYEDEGWRVRKDGSLFWASVVVSAVRDESGSLVGYAKITRDLTDRHRAEERLRHQGELMELIRHAAVAANEAESVEEALGEVIAQVCRGTGFPVGNAYVVAGEGGGELRPTGLWQLPDLERYRALLEATHATRFTPGVGLPGRVWDTGRPAWVADVARDPDFARPRAADDAGLRTAIAFPVCVDEEVVAVLEFFSDREVAPDEDLLETMASVGTQLGRVFERERAAEAILRAKEEAERANRAKSEFLSRMSHELRTPMNAILGFAQLLAADLEREEDRESVDQILRAGRHLLSLIDEVLDLAKIEASRLTLSLEPVPVRAVIGDSLSLVRSMAAQHDVSLSVGSDREWYARADHQRVQQVLLNLLSNAIKYNRRGGAVTVSCTERDGGRLRVAVSDTGRGIAAEHLERIFTPFDRLGAEGTGVEGTGLGLALSKGLVEAMGGELGVETVPGEGSTFWVELPLVDPPAEPWETDADEGSAEAGSPSGSRVVLYIEDNLSNLRLVERILARRPQIDLLVTMQGSLGLELARQHRPDLVLLDVHLPDLRGDQVLEQLRRDPEVAGIPVVVISADATPRQMQRLLEAGARAYLTKPFDVKQFLQTIDASLQTENP